MANETQAPKEILEAAESEIPTSREATEAQGESKTYGAEDLDNKRKALQEKNEKKYKYSSEEILNYSDGDLIDGLMQGKKMEKDDMKSALASLDDSGIQKLREIADESQERNKDRRGYNAENSHSEKLKKLAEQAEKLASLSNEAGQKKFIQNIIQSLESGTALNHKTLNQIESTLKLLQTHDPETKKIIFDAIKPAFLKAGEESALPLDKKTVNNIIKEYQD